MGDNTENHPFFFLARVMGGGFIAEASKCELGLDHPCPRTLFTNIHLSALGPPPVLLEMLCRRLCVAWCLDSITNLKPVNTLTAEGRGV